MASEALLQAIRSHDRQLVFAHDGTEERRYLELRQANANVGGEAMTHIVLLPDARKIEAIEEFLHGTQFRLGIISDTQVVGPEVHVKRFMIRHARLLGISAADVHVLKLMLGDEPDG